jgi:hypothetical protein
VGTQILSEDFLAHVPEAQRGSLRGKIAAPIERDIYSYGARIHLDGHQQCGDALRLVLPEKMICGSPAESNTEYSESASPCLAYHNVTQRYKKEELASRRAACVIMGAFR